MNPGEEEASRPGIVLAVDEPMTRASLRRLLEDAGFDVRAEAGDAETAIEVSVRERPRLCLVDLFISGRDPCRSRGFPAAP